MWREHPAACNIAANRGKKERAAAQPCTRQDLLLLLLSYAMLPTESERASQLLPVGPSSLALACPAAVRFHHLRDIVKRTERERATSASKATATADEAGFSSAADIRGAGLCTGTSLSSIRVHISVVLVLSSGRLQFSSLQEDCIVE